MVFVHAARLPLIKIIISKNAANAIKYMIWRRIKMRNRILVVILMSWFVFSTLFIAYLALEGAP